MEWRKIASVPTDGKESFLVLFPGGYIAHVYLTAPEPPLVQTFRHFGGGDQGRMAGWPTHWMPKPSQPTENTQ